MMEMVLIAVAIGLGSYAIGYSIGYRHGKQFEAALAEAAANVASAGLRANKIR